MPRWICVLLLPSDDLDQKKYLVCSVSAYGSGTAGSLLRTPWAGDLEIGPFGPTQNFPDASLWKGLAAVVQAESCPVLHRVRAVIVSSSRHEERRKLDLLQILACANASADVSVDKAPYMVGLAEQKASGSQSPQISQKCFNNNHFPLSMFLGTKCKKIYRPRRGSNPQP